MHQPFAALPHLLGKRYQEVAGLTGGESLSLCSDDAYASFVSLATEITGSSAQADGGCP